MPTLLTDRLVRNALKDRSRRIVLRDAGEPGLKLVIGPRGGTWAFETTVREKGTRRVHFSALGRVAEISLAMARIEAKKLKDDLRAGLDPNAERALAQARSTTLGAEAERWTPTGRAKHRATSRSALKLALDEMGLANAAPGELARRDLLRLIERHRHRPATARGRIGAMRRFLANLVEREILEINVAETLGRTALPRPPAARQRYPSAAEVQRLWAATSDLQARHRDLVRLLMLCPFRRGEAAALVAGEVDFGRAEIQLAAARTKSGRAFTMPLSREAVALIAPWLVGRGPQDRIFGPAFEWHFPLTRLRLGAGVPHFGLHDLRRLFVSELAEHGIGDLDLADGLLNHSASSSRTGVAGVYQRASRTGARREMMQSWAGLVVHAVEHGVWPREREQDSTVIDLVRIA